MLRDGCGGRRGGLRHAGDGRGLEVAEQRHGLVERVLRHTVVSTVVRQLHHQQQEVRHVGEGGDAGGEHDEDHVEEADEAGHEHEDQHQQDEPDHHPQHATGALRYSDGSGGGCGSSGSSISLSGCHHYSLSGLRGKSWNPLI